MLTLKFSKFRWRNARSQHSSDERSYLGAICLQCLRKMWPYDSLQRRLRGLPPFPSPRVCPRATRSSSFGPGNGATDGLGNEICGARRQNVRANKISILMTRRTDRINAATHARAWRQLGVSAVEFRPRIRNEQALETPQSSSSVLQ